LFMALNSTWAERQMAERDATLEQFAAASVMVRRHASMNPVAQHREVPTVQQVLDSPTIAGSTHETDVLLVHRRRRGRRGGPHKRSGTAGARERGQWWRRLAGVSRPAHRVVAGDLGRGGRPA